MTTFAAVVTPQTIIITTPDGKTHAITDAHEAYAEIRTALRDRNTAVMADDAGAAEDITTKIVEMLDVNTKVANAVEGDVTVTAGVVAYKGEALGGVIADRILWTLKSGFDAKPQMRFIANLMENPSKRAVDQLYGFLERHKMGISEDGHILAYKRVRDDFFDIHSGKFDNSPGKTVEMPRNRVDDDPNQTCSEGLHFCSMHYLPSYGVGPGNKIVIVKVNPRDVVAIPTDYHAAKVRCCLYVVLSEYTGDDKDDLLARQPVWSEKYFVIDGDDDDDGNYDADEEDDVPFSSGCGPSGERCDDCSCD
jgi:hypothetical protein